MNKFTDGKWQVNEELFGTHGLIEIIDEIEYLTLARIPIESEDDSMTERFCKYEEAIANSKLIIAAPDLLNELQKALEFIENGACTVRNEKRIELEDSIKQAIKKALS